MQITLLKPTELFRIVYLFDILAAVVFAVSGALVASRKNLDVMGFMWFSVITGAGEALRRTQQENSGSPGSITAAGRDASNAVPLRYEKSICALNFTNRGCSTDVGVSHEPAGFAAVGSTKFCL